MKDKQRSLIILRRRSIATILAFFVATTTVDFIMPTLAALILLCQLLLVFVAIVVQRAASARVTAQDNEAKIPSPLPLGQWTDGELIKEGSEAALTELDARRTLRANSAAKDKARKADIHRTH